MSTNPPNFHAITTVDQFQELMKNNLERISLINFWASWAEPCKVMNELVLDLAKKYPDIQVLHVEAEELPDITDNFDVQSVPFVSVLRGHEVLTKVEGADAAALTAAVAKHTQKIAAPLSTTTQAPATPPAAPASFEEKGESPDDLEKRMKALMNKSKVVLFMKGDPTTPRCGFSRRTVALLQDHKVEFTTFDILTDESVRQGLKVLNGWPTFPQIIINNEFVGGLDVVTEMAENGELQELLAA
ncbi:glutaredoxin [Athelia psychrophila]|uniref:Glutaredoxin n=1 Tax=Athelia psychrophila TaxID=1759441 RepID=A0A165ZDV4_9AGAM|nr:glutaredoxin [Fibularhizoctonia sp. CBS 109695]